MTHTWLDELDKTSWACSEFFQTHPWVTKVLIIAPGLPMGEHFSKLLTSGELGYQSSHSQAKSSL